MFVIEERGRELRVEGVEIGSFDTLEVAEAALKEYITDEYPVNLENVEFEIIERTVVKRFRVEFTATVKDVTND